MDTPPRRRWFQFRLRTLLVLLTVAAVGLAWFVRERRWIAEQQRMLRPYSMSYYIVAPNWRDRLWGYDNRHNVYEIRADSISDDEMEYLQRLPRLAELNITHSPKLTGRGLAYLRDVPSLLSLTLTETGVTDAGLKHLAGVTKLESLRLTGDELSGKGFVHLAGLTRLKRLHIEGRRITDEGLKHLGRMRELDGLAIRGDRCTDDGLKHLYDFKQLRWLDIDAPGISEAGLTELRRALPRCEVERLSRTAP